MAKTKKAQRRAAKVNRRDKEFARQAAAHEQAKKNPTPKKVYQGGKYSDRRVNVEVEEFDGYTVKSWTDPRITGTTPEVRSRQYDDFYDERNKENDMFGCGFRLYDAVNNRVKDYEFKTRKGFQTFIRHRFSPEGIMEFYKEAGLSIDGDGPIQVSMPSIGVSDINVCNPENREYIDLGCELIARMRYGEISERYAKLYAAMFIEPFKKAA